MSRPKQPEPDWGKITQRYLPALTRTASRVVALGWAEKNAGNFSIRIEDYLLTKITGGSMQQVAREPRSSICIVQPQKVGWRYRVLPSGVKPTKELPTHILGQRILKRFRPAEIVLFHTHPSDIVRLTTLFPQPRTLLRKLTPFIKNFPDVVTALPFLKPGSHSLARATARALKNYRLIIWVNHGVIASGKTLQETLRLIQQLNAVAQKILCQR
ncbi:hypothetical protein HPY86_03005 [candidate division WOR-3 bacterium]|nr:hypothetical protein [candidate division WOR-3 bacterium]